MNSLESYRFLIDTKESGCATNECLLDKFRQVAHEERHRLKKSFDNVRMSMVSINDEVAASLYLDEILDQIKRMNDLHIGYISLMSMFECMEKHLKHNCTIGISQTGRNKLDGVYRAIKTITDDLRQKDISEVKIVQSGYSDGYIINEMTALINLEVLKLFVWVMMEVPIDSVSRYKAFMAVIKASSPLTIGKTSPAITEFMLEEIPEWDKF